MTSHRPARILTFDIVPALLTDEVSRTAKIEELLRETHSETTLDQACAQVDKIIAGMIAQTGVMPLPPDFPEDLMPRILALVNDLTATPLPGIP